MTAPAVETIAVVFASQTGTAEQIAKHIDSELRSRGFPASSQGCVAMNEMDVSQPLSPKTAFIFVSSTTGDGDPPDNSTTFWRNVRRHVKKNGAKLFEGVQYTVLGLGDTNYSSFGAHPNKIDAKVSEMGGRLFYPKAIADEVETIEATVDPWIAGLWPALEKLCPPSKKQMDNIQKVDGTVEKVVENLESLNLDALKGGYKLPFDKEFLASVPEQLTGISKLPELVLDIKYTGNNRNADQKTCFIPPETGADGEPIYTQRSPFYGRLIKSRVMTTPDALKKTLYVTIDSEGMNVNYQPGDAFGILCGNRDELVHSCLKAMGLEPGAEFEIAPVNGQPASAIPTHLTGKSTVEELFRYHLDLTSQPRKVFYHALANFSNDLDEKKLLLFLASRQGATKLKELLEHFPTLLDWFVTFPSCRKIPLAYLIQLLPPLKPRYYSVANSPLKTGSKLSFAFNVVQYTTPDPVKAERFGVCTTHLNNVQDKLPISIPIFHRTSADFHLPSDITKPIIMVGPGTGIAPFIGFLQHRQEQRKLNNVEVGLTWLFYGCRNPHHDFLFKNDLIEFQKDGTLSRLSVSLSRYQDAISARDWNEYESVAVMKYVQDKIRHFGKEIVTLMCENEAYFFVCGDAQGMAKAVHTTLAELVQEHRGMDMEDAMLTVMSWMNAKRYVRDVWA